jgi:hypothetical protein
MLPEIVEPDWMMELAAITVMKGGRLLGGCELLPVALVHVPPQATGFGSVELAKPLKLWGAPPPLVEFNEAQCAPQNVTWLPTTAFSSPITKFPSKVGVGVGNGVPVGVALGVPAAVAVAVGLAVGVALGVWVALGVGVGVWVALGVGVGVWVALGVAVAVEVAVGVTVEVAVGVAVEVAVGLAVGDGTAVVVAVAVGVGEGVTPCPVIVMRPLAWAGVTVFRLALMKKKLFGFADQASGVFAPGVLLTLSILKL